MTDPETGGRNQLNCGRCKLAFRDGEEISFDAEGRIGGENEYQGLKVIYAENHRHSECPVSVEELLSPVDGFGPERIEAVSDKNRAASELLAGKTWPLEAVDGVGDELVRRATQGVREWKKLNKGRYPDGTEMIE